MVRSIHGKEFVFTASSLSSLTGLSRQTLSRPEYRMLWDEAFNEMVAVDNSSANSSSEFDKLKVQLMKTEKKNAQLSEKLSRSEKLRQRYFDEKNELADKYSHLLFLNLALLRRMRLYGMKVDDLMIDLNHYRDAEDAQDSGRS